MIAKIRATLIKATIFVLFSYKPVHRLPGQQTVQRYRQRDLLLGPDRPRPALVALLHHSNHRPRNHTHRLRTHTHHRHIHRPP